MAETAPTILHVDMDAFFASVEVLDNPSLKGKPVIVGGTGPRGVVAACTYEARAFGVRSAMPMVTARQRCPSAIVLPGRFDRYQAISSLVHGVFHQVSDEVEAIGLDEAFIECAPAVRRMGGSVAIAHWLRREIEAQTGLLCSVGIGSTKMIAKLASRQAKPRATAAGVGPGSGIFMVERGAEKAFLGPLPVRALWGVGPQTADKLTRLGIATVGQLAEIEPAVLARAIGASAGAHLAAVASGRDDDPVEARRPARSIGQEVTFAVDLDSRAELGRIASRQADHVGNQLRAKGLTARTVALKVRFGDFSTVVKRRTLPQPFDTGQAIAKVALELFDEVRLRGGVRLIGVSVATLGDAAVEQLTLGLDDGGTQAEQERWAPVADTIDAVRARFGPTALGLGSDLRHGQMADTTKRSDERWGPTDPA